MSKAPMVLMILDGWGHREDQQDNAISMAHPQNFYNLWDAYPHTLLECFGNAVGLPRGQMGNSEVGHLNIGAGRIVFQEITRITQAIEDRSFFTNPVFLKAMDDARRHNGAVHLLGLVSDGGVHSDLTHLFALLELCKDQGIDSVFVHAFLDGRDVAPQSAMEYISLLENFMRQLGLGRIASVGGRFYGMDRDNRWERIEKAYQSIVLGEGLQAAKAQAAIERSYEARVSDEFMEPVVIVDEQGQPIGRISDGDSVIFFNFRADRARQISHSLLDKTMDRFERKIVPAIHYVCMTQYDAGLAAPVAFPPQNLDNTLGEVLSAAGLKQLRIAETEKYAHVTFFFNGGVERANPGEDRVLIPSPQVATYNLQPEMSAFEVTQRVLQEIDRDFYDVVIMNYANPDMVGHTGVLEAAVKAVKTIDDCLIQVISRVQEKNGQVIITADHGNCEMMTDAVNGCPFTAHTTNKVPFILVDDRHQGKTLREGSLRDVAPTMLGLLGLPAPDEMTGNTLLSME
ncbi:MAG TPA: 2,3-bisphosphoglycerate-independent phosphoglycerate mutase [Syntrophomonas sp.]|nr:2,3-bisphosphoglycerate-independent phosphoglycerate mutase [Syntrophomonas sp.]